MVLPTICAGSRAGVSPLALSGKSQEVCLRVSSRPYADAK